MGGVTKNPCSIEIYNIKSGMWVKGPPLPYGETNASCAPLPPTSKYACLAIGNRTKKTNYTSNVYGLDRTFTEWTLLGKIEKGSQNYTALAPF